MSDLEYWPPSGCFFLYNTYLGFANHDLAGKEDVFWMWMCLHNDREVSGRCWDIMELGSFRDWVIFFSVLLFLFKMYTLSYIFCNAAQLAARIG